MLKIKFCGAAGGHVTGSRHLITSSKGNILLDCGFFQGKRSESDLRNRNFSFDPTGVDAMVVSHAHIDHTGAIPCLVKNGFNGRIYLNDITTEILKIMLVDSAKLQREDAEFYNKLHGEKGDVIEPIYTEEDVFKAFGMFKVVRRNTVFSPSEGVYVRFINAGHILGSSSVYIDVSGTKILYTGDLGRRNQLILRPPSFKEYVDYLIIETTYGNRLHSDPEDVFELIKSIMNKIYERKSKLIIPSFSLERTQEVINIFDRLRHDKNIAKIPIFVDSPMSVKITDIYNKHINEEDYSDDFKSYAASDRNPFGYDEIFYISGKEESKRLNSMKGPVVIISASGMCEGGRVLHHLRNSIESSDNVLLLVGFQAENTLGRKLKDGAKKVKIFGIEHEVKMEIYSVDFLSSHADRDDLLSYVEMIKPQKGVFLVHGENDQRTALKNILVEKGYHNVFLPDLDEEFEI